MSVLERRVQILVEREQYARLEKAAAKQSRSVASLIREAIAEYLGGGQDARSAALDWLLAQEPDSGPGQAWEDARRHLEDALPRYQ